jgi:hypothetical protein
MAVLWSVHFWRSQHKSKPDIYDLLELGERFIPEAAHNAQDNAGEEETGERVKRPF